MRSYVFLDEFDRLCDGSGENVGDAVQHYTDSLVVLGSKQVTERLENTLHWTEG